MTEEWRPVSHWRGSYEVSNLGRVRSVTRTVVRGNGTAQTWTGRMLRRTIGSTGYPQVHLRNRSGSTVQKVHRLVAMAFLGQPPDGCEVNHKDGNKLNPRLENLEWVTPRQNRKHAWDTGLRNRSHLPVNCGSQNQRAKLSESIVASAREEAKAGATYASLARKYGVHKTTMRSAVNGETWLLPDPPKA